MKNKEIEELLNNFQEVLDNPKYTDEMYNGKLIEFDKTYDLEQDEIKLLLSYIEQLETNYKEANESVTWWTNRYNAIVKQNDDNHKKVVKLENNRDKAIEYVEEKGRLKYNPNELLNILRGGSDEF